MARLESVDIIGPLPIMNDPHLMYCKAGGKTFIVPCRLSEVILYDDFRSKATNENPYHLLELILNANKLVIESAIIKSNGSSLYGNIYFKNFDGKMSRVVFENVASLINICFYIGEYVDIDDTVLASLPDCGMAIAVMKDTFGVLRPFPKVNKTEELELISNFVDEVGLSEQSS